MNEDVRRAVAARILGDNAATGGSLFSLGLPLYRGGLAVLSQSRIPEDVRPPFILVGAPFAATDADSKTRIGNTENLDVTVIDYENAKTPPARIDRLARRVRYLLHRGSIEITGHESIIMRAGSPIEGEAGEGLASRVIGLTIRTQEN